MIGAACYNKKIQNILCIYLIMSCYRDNSIIPLLAMNILFNSTLLLNRIFMANKSRVLDLNKKKTTTMHFYTFLIIYHYHA